MTPTARKRRNGENDTEMAKLRNQLAEADAKVAAFKDQAKQLTEANAKIAALEQQTEGLKAEVYKRRFDREMVKQAEKDVEAAEMLVALQGGRR